MIKLDYKLHDEVWTPQERARITTYSYVHLETGFVGKQTFIVNGVDLGNNSISIFDFAATLLSAVRRFEAGEAESTCYDLDSPWRMYFKRQGDNIEISDNAGRDRAVASLSEFKRTVLSYVAKVRDELCKKFPELRENETFLQALDEHRQAA